MWPCKLVKNKKKAKKKKKFFFFLKKCNTHYQRNRLFRYDVNGKETIDVMCQIFRFFDVYR